MKFPLIDLKSAAANRQRLARLRAEEVVAAARNTARSRVYGAAKLEQQR